MTVYDWAASHSSSVLPPGTCAVHGYHGCVSCPTCSSSALPPRRLSAPDDGLDVRGMAEALTEAQRIEHSFSVRARHEAAIRNVEQTIWPALATTIRELPIALTLRDPDTLLEELRRLASIGELARFEAEKLEGRA